MGEYITNTEFKTLLEDILYKLENNNESECQDMLNNIIADLESNDKYIDRTYISSLRSRKRQSRIDEINEMLKKMSVEQVNNVHKYTVNEFDEPNHEAEALAAIVELSRKSSVKETKGAE